jgi:6-pyruvoyltetrahydropterin/6-carboxytetrahydropterin synthase
VDRARLIRSYAFRATHHYGRPEWGDARNREIFGLQVEPHEHEWRVEIRLAGPIDPTTGWIVDLTEVDRAVKELLGSWDGGDLNAEIPEVASGELQPSTENLARWIFTRLSPLPGAGISLLEVRVFESPELGAAYPDSKEA